MSSAPPADDPRYPWKSTNPEENGNIEDHNTFDNNKKKKQRNEKRSSSKSKPARPPLPHGFRNASHDPDNPQGDPKLSGQKPNKGKGFLNALFGTRQLAHDKDRETYVKVTIRELFIYLFYLAVLCILTLGTASSSSYYFSKVIMDLFVTKKIPDLQYDYSFQDSVTIDHFWKFVEGPMLDGLYNEFLYADGTIKSPNIAQTPLMTTNGILFVNRLVGVPRLRQIRVKPDSCEIAPNFRHLIRQCYAPYSSDAEDTTKHWGYYVGTPWTYFTAEEIHGSSYWGKFGNYCGGGSYLDLKIDKISKNATGSSSSSPTISAKELTRSEIMNLKEKHWISKATRAIFLEFTVYNANLNLFCFVKLIWEVPATGGVVTSASIQTANLLRYTGWFNLYIIFPCEIIFCIFTLYYLIQEFYEMCVAGCKRYLKDVWSYLDLSMLMFSMFLIALSIVRYFIVQNEIEKIVIEEGVFYPLQTVAFWQSVYQYCLAILLFISWLKLFKYMAFNRTMTQLSRTLSRCAADVGGFAFMFSIVFAAFAQLGYLMFGSQVRDFSTFGDSVFTLLRLILGDFDFREIESANRILGPIYFIAYVFFVFFVLLNMFLAIINDTFGEVKAEVQARGNEFHLVDYFKRGWNNLCGRFGRKNKQLDEKYAFQLASADGVITYDEIRKNLEDAGFSAVEIEMFLARYELDHHRPLDEDEIQHILRKLEGKDNTNKDTSTLTASDYISHQVYQQELESLEKRVSAMESAISNVIYKIDTMLNKVQRLK